MDPPDVDLVKSSLDIPSLFDIDDFKNQFQHIVDQLDGSNVDEVRFSMLKHLSSKGLDKNESHPRAEYPTKSNFR